MNRIGRVALLGLSVLALSIAGCAPRKRPPAPPAPPVIVTPLPGQVMSPQTYVTTAASFDLFVIRASEMAAVRARDPGVRAQASAELADHRGLGAQLSFAGRRLNLLPSDQMGRSDAERLALLEASADFDAAYTKQMIATHLYHLKVSGDVAMRGTSPTLRPVARNAADVIARHLDRWRAP